MSSPASGLPSPAIAAGLSNYLDELRDFSATHNLPAGKPDDLQALCDRLASDHSFLDEFQSMIRSILYRENFRSTPANLLSLVGQTWGGPDTPDLNGDLHPPICDLASFLRDAMKLPRFVESESSEDESPLEAFAFPEEHHHLVARELSESSPSILEDTTDPLNPASTTPSDPPQTPWWAESAASQAFPEHTQSPDFLQQRELVTSTEITPLTTDPWQTNSTFHQELLRFAERRR